MKQPLGTLLVVSGPSGSGKTTLCRRATENGLCVYSISCTCLLYTSDAADD